MIPGGGGSLNAVWRWMFQLRIDASSCKDPLTCAHVVSMLDRLHHNLRGGTPNTDALTGVLNALSQAEYLISRNLKPGSRAWGDPHVGNRAWGDPHVDNRAWGDPHVGNRAWGDPHVDNRAWGSPSGGGILRRPATTGR